MGLPRSESSRVSQTNAWHHKPRVRRYQRRKRRAYPRKCKICGGKSYSERCRLCEYTLLQINEIIRLYLEETPPEKMDNAVAEFDRIYYSNLQLRVFYNTACEAVRHTIANPNEPIVLVEPNFSKVPEPKVLSVLEESGVISRREGEIYAGPLLQKLVRLRLTGYILTDQEFSRQLRIIYSVLTITIASTLLKRGEFNPRVVMGILRMISSHVLRNLESSDIPREVLSSTWKAGFRDVNLRVQAHVEWDLLGLTPNTSPRIFENYVPEKEQYISKECMAYYYEYIRDRIREREQERTR